MDQKLIERVLKKFSPNMLTFFYTSTDSTNTRAKEFANKGFWGDAVFIADEQTSGRGRLGRSFLSEGNKGLYLSILLGREKSIKASLHVTTYMSVIACRVIEEFTNLSPKIKWVNDIFLNGKKASGILTEGKIDPSTGDLDYTVCGIGINVLKQDFNNEVRGIATSIEEESGIQLDISLLASRIIEEFFNNLHLVGSREISKEYKDRSLLIGKQVDVIKASKTYSAKVVDITDDCALLLQLDNGEKETLFTGEVSIKIN